METKTFEIFRAKDGRGVSNLLLVIDEAIPDIYIGSALLVPIADGFKDPIKVDVIMDEKGAPMRTNLNTCVVTKYHHQ
jgi:hypothetical protein